MYVKHEKEMISYPQKLIPQNILRTANPQKLIPQNTKYFFGPSSAIINSALINSLKVGENI